MTEMCKKCGMRPVEEGKELCPACESKKQKIMTTIIEIGGAAALAAILIFKETIKATFKSLFSDKG